MQSEYYGFWKANTTVLMLQLVVGLLVFAKTGNAWESVIVVGLVTLLLCVSGLLGDDIQTVAVPAFTAPGIILFLVPNKDWQDIAGVVICLALTMLLASMIVDTVTHRQRGSRFMWFVMVMPVLSTVIGGPILLFQHLHKTSNVPNP